MTAKLLLVDDEPGVREAVTAYLEDSGFEVTAVANGQAALEYLETNVPDLIITDIMMPQMDGYAFLETVRQQPHLNHIPVIFLTARGMKRDRIQGYDAGCDAYLAKPFDPDELVAIIKNLLRRQAAARDETEPNLANLAQQIAELRAMLVQQGKRNPTAPPIQLDLTPREASVLQLVVKGLMNKEIASQLNTSVRNIEKYVSRLFVKTGTSSRTELVRFALEHGLAD
ncbi:MULTISPECIES: response regulator transcription factor [unclassified Thermosynechococcus]|uniref:response regulator transcription factor n=1 Tax=unclassified Thermosynechococcus TaxID=2622553 RepID=UPI0026733E5C|nr:MULTISPECIES: response regulator transcription factor [unclassified Thermosynechococcus]MDR7922227.1 response regulator transcription factor [Thermosynechococcus sp. HY213]WKT80131.1 response regulator transcription factor [Thermosynechococcus sp. PP45]WNC23741.1 response regulator transcription factor [Thermosynechococcus sp. PP551]WNC26317.1 response regulator transcription factor [Thermosynechococcus sp. PP555]WNC28881.1 response regulator transcription factor [Thermosynechococcus sp. PK